MILNGQCLRLADNSIKCININIDALNKAVSQPFMAKPFIEQITSAENILVILSPDIDENVYEYITNICSDKKISIISQNIPEKYKQYELQLNNNNTDDYEFFGACAGRAPMLVHKSIPQYDMVVIISSVMLNSFGGYLGSVSTLFTNITAAKTQAYVVQYALQDSLFHIQKLHSGVTIRNPVYESMREGLITASKAVNSFAVNIASDYAYQNEIENTVCAGDLFISQIEAQNSISSFYNSIQPAVNFDGIRMRVTCYNNVIYFISRIEMACRHLVKGGRLLIDINDMQSFGNTTFQEIFYKNTLEEIADSVTESNYMECFYAFILKYYTMHYHIALPYFENLNNALIQAGLNPLRKLEYNSFLANCKNIKEM